MKYLPPKGTQDLWGVKFYAYDSITKTILKVIEQYGFRQIRTPVFEPINILAKNAGSEIIDQIYTFEDKGGRPMGIKSDITPAIARFIAGNGQSMPKPIKLACYDRVYRYERPQAGRSREIAQINAELFGVAGSAAEAELLACLYQCYTELGLPEVTIDIGFRPLLEACIRKQNIADDQVMAVARLIDKRDKISQQDFVEGLTTCGVTKVALKNFELLLTLQGPLAATLQKARQAFAGDKQLVGYIEQLEDVSAKLKTYGIVTNFRLNLGLARGLEYYTGIIFEAKVPESSFGSIGSGGRYDNLIKSFGGQDTPAVGFSMGLYRVYLALEELGRLDKIAVLPATDYYLVSDGETLSKQAMVSYAQKLRAQGLAVEIDLLGKSLSKQVQIAKERGAQKVMVFKQDGVKKIKSKIIDFQKDTEALTEP